MQYSENSVLQNMSQLNDNQCIALDANCGFNSYKVSVNYTEWQTVLKTLIYSIDSFFYFLVVRLLVFLRCIEMPARTSDEKGVCHSVCLSNACFVTKRKRDLFRYLYHTKDHLIQFFRRKMVVGTTPST